MSPEQRRNLDIEIGFLEGLLRRDPAYCDVLQLLADDYTRRGRFAEGLDLDLRLATLRPQEPMVHYNLACSYALTDQHAKALAAISKAIDLGYNDFRYMSRDPDLAAFRKTSYYRRLRERIRKLSLRIGGL